MVVSGAADAGGEVVGVAFWDGRVWLEDVYAWHVVR